MGVVQVIVRSGTYLHAVQKMQRALYEFHIRGVKTNILFLENVLRHPEFLSGRATTSFIERRAPLRAADVVHADVKSTLSAVHPSYSVAFLVVWLTLKVLPEKCYPSGGFLTKNVGVQSMSCDAGIPNCLTST
jgi:hypothetical protein